MNPTEKREPSPQIARTLRWKKVRTVPAGLPDGVDCEHSPTCSCCGAACPAYAILDTEYRWWGRDCFARACGVPPPDRSDAARWDKGRRREAWQLLHRATRLWRAGRRALPRARVVRRGPSIVGFEWLWDGGPPGKPGSWRGAQDFVYNTRGIDHIRQRVADEIAFMAVIVAENDKERAWSKAHPAYSPRHQDLLSAEEIGRHGGFHIDLEDSDG